MNYLIIVAGGRGERFNRDLQSGDRKSLILATKKVARNKIFASLGKFPLLYWTLLAFEKSKLIDEIIISAAGADIKKIREIIEKYSFKKVTDVIEALDSRQKSTFSVLEKFRSKMKKGDLVGVHNAVNPFVGFAEIRDVFKSARKYKAALLAQSAKDTVKVSNEGGFVVETPLRQYSWYAQTPQVATFEALWKAHSKANEDKFVGTDDAQLLERIGIKPKIVTCSNANFKITFSEDLAAASRILKKWTPHQNPAGKQVSNGASKFGAG